MRQSGPSVIKKIILLAAGVLFGFILSRIFFVSYITTDNTMLPEIKKGERIIALKISTVGFGDKVLINSPVENSRVLVKRIIASSGDVVEIRNKVIFLNGKKLQYQWKTIMNDRRILPPNFTFRDNMKALNLYDNEFFVIGDNLDSGFDSRTFGKILKESVIGRIIYHF